MSKPTITTQSLTTTSALQLCQAAIQQAELIGIHICISVVCPSGRQLASASMNNAPLISQGVAYKKAMTAASFKIPTKDWQTRLIERNNTLFALQSEPDFTFLGGGLPIHFEDSLIGAIGVSGGSEQQDIECATESIKKTLFK